MIPSLMTQGGSKLSWITAICIVTLGHVAPRESFSQDTAAIPRHQVTREMHRAVSFFRKHASAGGGYVYQLSADLAKREGEGKVASTTAWIEPPGTPAVGIGFLNAYQTCKDPLLLEAAKETAKALRQGQLESGGWDNLIEFAPADRARYAYRTDTETARKGKLRNTSTFDDNKSQSAIRFLMELDKELQFADRLVHESVTYALQAVLKSQYPNGGWPQRFSEFPDPAQYPVVPASLPTKWPATYPGKKYSDYYTLNDNTVSDLIELLLDAADIYQQPKYLDAACRGGDFLILAQLPEPQPGWSQQYDRNMQPAWARKFEPPAISGGESQRVMRTLLHLYLRTAGKIENSQRFLTPLETAIPYYQRSQLANRKLARFYELRSNRPLFFTKQYELTYSSDDMPTHYAFIISSKMDEIEREFHAIQSAPVKATSKSPATHMTKRTDALDAKVATTIAELDSRGAWVEEGQLKYHGENDDTTHVIRSRTFVTNLMVLATWLGAE